MGTRCQIIVVDSGVAIYQHSDGQPDDGGVLSILLPALTEFHKYRPGKEPAYLTAQLTYRLIKAHNEAIDATLRRRKRRQFYRLNPGELEKDVETFSTADALHRDIEWLYLVHSDHVEVRKPNSEFSDQPCIGHTTLDRKVTFDGKKYRG